MTALPLRIQFLAAWIGGDAELAIDYSTAPTAQQRREIAAATLALNPLWAAGTRFALSLEANPICLAAPR